MGQRQVLTTSASRSIFASFRVSFVVISRLLARFRNELEKVGLLQRKTSQFCESCTSTSKPLTHMSASKLANVAAYMQSRRVDRYGEYVPASSTGELLFPNRITLYNRTNSS